MNARKRFVSLSRLAAMALGAFLVMSLWAADASASGGNKSTIEFVGFAKNPDFYAVLHKDKLAGNTLAVYQVGVPTAVVAYPLEGKSKKKALKSPEIAPYEIQTSGHVDGAKAPAGFSLVGSQVGAQFQVALTDGTNVSTLGYVALAADDSGTEFAKGKVKSVHWTADGGRVVAIVHQKLGGEWPMDADSIVAFALAAAQ